MALPSEKLAESLATLKALPIRSPVRELMPAFLELLQNEKEPAVRVVLGHFAFVYIHPYFRGRGH